MFHNMRNSQNFETAHREKTPYTEQELLQALLAQWRLMASYSAY